MRKNKTIIIFLLKFFITYFVLSGLYSIYLYKSQDKVDIFSCAPVTMQVAKHTNTLAKFFGFNSKIEQNDSELSVKFYLDDDHILNIVEGCNSISIIILFLSFIIAFSGNVKDTIFFGIFGIVTIYIINLIRILLIGILYQKYPQHEYFLHNLLFPSIVYGYIFLLWIVWVKFFSHYNKLKNG